jgi:hypothetical protein
MSAVIDPELSDAAIVERSRRSPDMFGVLYDRYASQLYRYAYRRVGPDFVEDVVAETFLAAFSRRDSYDVSRRDARPWLFGIVTREIAVGTGPRELGTGRWPGQRPVRRNKFRAPGRPGRDVGPAT